MEEKTGEPKEALEEDLRMIDLDLTCLGLPRTK